MMGIVSLLADVTYEGARSITGPYMLTLGAGALIVGSVSGAGEFAGYALRIITGKIADATGRHWFMTSAGYILNLFSVPLLAFAGSWESASVLIISERIGKAIRTPSRDTLLSHAVREVGTGWGFGIHQSLDQVGAITGPVLVSIVLYVTHDFRDAFEFLLIPAVMAMVVLYLTAREFRFTESEERRIISDKNIPDRSLRLYYLFVFLSAGGMVHFNIVSYHVKLNSITVDALIPILYSTLMVANALFSMISGRIYDRSGTGAMIAIPVMSVIIPFLSLSCQNLGIIAGMILMGGVMGMQDTMMRALIADAVPSGKIGTAFGMFGMVYGLGWFSGSALMGFLYDHSINLLYLFVAGVELISAVVLILFFRHEKSNF